MSAAGSAMENDSATPLLDVCQVSHTYRASSLLRRKSAPHSAVSDVSLQVKAGEVLGIVGESGSGKSTLSRIMAGLARPSTGAVRFRGHDIRALDRAGRLAFRRGVQMVFQDPYSSLDPRMRVRTILTEPLRALRLPSNRADTVTELLHSVGLHEDAADRYPHEFSGGQRQRIAIARALAPGPDILLADEPVSALDPSIQAQILNLFQDLIAARSLTVVLVTHDLAVVGHMADRIGVMYQGRMVELADATTIFERPAHDHTRSLLEASRLEMATQE